MHIDEGKRFDKRNIARNIKDGVIVQKDYEIFLSKLPDATDKLFNPEEDPNLSEEGISEKEGETVKKKKIKKKLRTKGK